MTVHGSDYVLKLPRRTPPGGPPPGSRRAAALSRSRSPVQTALQVPARGSKRGCEEPATTSRKACPAPAGPPGGPDRRRKGFREGLAGSCTALQGALPPPEGVLGRPCRIFPGVAGVVCRFLQGPPDPCALPPGPGRGPSTSRHPRRRAYHVPASPPGQPGADRGPTTRWAAWEKERTARARGRTRGAQGDEERGSERTARADRKGGDFSRNLGSCSAEPIPFISEPLRPLRPCGPLPSPWSEQLRP